ATFCLTGSIGYRRAWTDKATRIQLAGACWHAERLPGPLLGPTARVTMLRASFCVPPGSPRFVVPGGEEDFASKMQRLKSVLDDPAGEAERKSQEADLSEGTGDSVRCGKLFADSGPLLGPPPSWLPKSLSKEAEDAAEAYLRKVHQVEYSLEAWNGAVQAGTTLLRLCGGWKEAVGALRYAWRARGEDHFAGLFDHHLDSHLPEDLLAWVRRVAQERVKAEYRGTQRARVKATPHPSLKDHVEEARQLIWQDATRGRVLLMSPGPDEEDLLDGVVSVPLARVPKYNPDRSVSSKGRVIWDARVVNELCHKDDHFPAIQPRYAEVVRLVMWYKSRYPGKDVSEAFKWLWVEQDDCRLFGADLPTEGATRDSRGDASRPVTVLYLAMTFGWTGAPGEFMAFAWAIKLLHRACGPDRPEWHDSSSFRSLALMDDSVVIEPDLGLRPQLSVDALEEAIRQTLGPLAINAAKDVEEGTLTTRKLIWGLEFDTEAGTCRLPPLKVERAYHVLQSPYFDAGQTKVPLKEVQVLRGSQQFWLGVLPQLAPYLQSTNALLGPADREGHVVLRGNEAEQSAQWEAFWSAIELQRLLVGSRQFWEARFVSQLEHALTTPELLALPEVKRNLVWVSADATPLGAIDWTARVAANAQDSTDLEARTEPEEDLVQIGVAELLALLVLVVARKEAWAGSVVLYLGDNTNVQDWLRKRQAGNAQANHLLKVLGALEGVHGLQVRGAYLRTYHNQTADDLTRLDPDRVMEQQRLTRLSVPDDWGRVLGEAWHRRALLWVGQPDSDRQMALQLAARRIGPAPPRAMPAFGWKVHELGASEHGVCTRAFFAAGGLKHDPQDSLATLEGAPTVQRSAPGEEETPTQEERLLCVATVTGEAEARRVVSGVPAQAASTWIDSFRPLAVEAICTEDAQNRWEWWTEEFTGRTFKEQVHKLPGEGWDATDDDESDARLALKGKGAHKGRRDQEKLERLRGSFRARSDADRRRLVKILRHEAALLGLPIREDGWVSLKDLNECVGTISGEDAARIIGRDEKDRLILSQEGEEVWVAAVSGHTMAGVVGPGRELPLQEVPEVLVHGSYARHSNNILKVRFLLTTNDIYLAPDGIPPEYISQIESWRKGPVPFPPRAAGSSVGRSAPGTAAGSRREGAAKTAAEKAQQRAEAVAEHKEAARFTERQEARRKLASAAPRGTVGVELQRALDSDCESCSDRREQSTLSGAAYATQRLRAMEARPPPEPVVLRPRHQPGTPARGGEQGALGSTDGPAETSERPEPELGDEELIEVAEQRNSDQYPPEGSPKGDEPMPSVEHSAPGIAEATLEGDEPMPSVERSAPGIAEVEPAVGPGLGASKTTAQEAALKEEQAAPGESASTSAEARFAPGEGETQAIWGPKVEEGGPLQPLVDAAQALGEVALAEPEAIALKVDPDTLTAEIGKMSLEDEDPDWSGDEAEIPVATALPGEAASSSTKQEEGRGTKKELELDETEEPPRRRKVVLATGQLSLLRALAAANASNWSGVQRALREAHGSGEEKSELVENLTSLAQAFSKNRDACAQAATSRVAELEGAEAAYFAAPPALAELERKNPVMPSMDKSLGWINHARFLQDKEAAGVWVARRKEKSRLRAAAHRAAQQTAEGAGAGVQDPVRDQADAASHLNFQMNEAARDNLRRFQAELRAGELDAPMRAAVAQKRKPESERRRRIKWARFCEKQGKTRKYDPTESEQNHPYAHSGSPHLERAMRSGPGRCPTEDGLENREIPGTMGDGRYLQHTASECTTGTH
ncbi:unnamed protein product, partial [Symbiodinium sp. CCMP2592]